MQPTTPTPTPAPPVLEPVIELIRTQRQNVGYALLGAAVLFLALTGWLTLKTTKTAAAPDANASEKDKDKDKAENPFKPPQLDATEVTQPNRNDYFVGAVAAFLVFVVFAALGGFLLASPPKPKEDEQRTQARQVVLILGSAVGAALILAGAVYFYLWSESLMKWLDKGELSEAWRVAAPLLMVVLGGALMFVSTQPARAEERNNAPIRQFIYGSNFGLTVLMLFVVLVIVNAVVAMRMPNKLDTTGNSFYTLNPQTKQLLEGLDQPLHAYAIFQDSGDAVTEDTKRLLTGCRDINPSKFQVTFLSPTLNKDAINKLRSEHPLAKLSQEGVLLVAGEEGSTDGKRHRFIRSEEFEETKDGPDGRPVLAFNGEPKLLRELMFLAENKQKPKVYFTQSSGELSLTGGRERRDPQRSAVALKAYLEKNNFEVLPLTFELTGPAKVPDDATIVIIADPTEALPPAGSEAIRKYMSEPRPGGGKGKLVVLAGQQPGSERDRKALKIGIEPMLQTFGVRFSDRFLYNADRSPQGVEGSPITVAGVTDEAQEARNPVALVFGASLKRRALLGAREVGPVQGGGAQAVTILESLGGRLTWTEAEYAPNPDDAWTALAKRFKAIGDSKGTEAENERLAAALSQEYQVTTRPRPLGVFVSEGETARVAVYGCGWFMSDDAGIRSGGRGQPTTYWLDLMVSTLDWLRDRQAMSGITEKPYTTYTLKPGYDTLRMLWVPLALSVLVVGAFGAGVWVVRRK